MEHIDFRSVGEQDHRLADRVYEHLALPKSTFIGARITKKMLIDNNELGGADKSLVIDVIQSIEWVNTLKPETLNIPVYVTDTVEYIEIAVIRVVLKNSAKEKEAKFRNKLKSVVKLLQAVIPYPVILLVEMGEELVISLADKRINQADKTKLVIEHLYSSDWLTLENLTESESLFLSDFSLKHVSKLNYFDLYHDFISMLISLEISKITGRYINKNINNKESKSQVAEPNDNDDQTVLLQEFEGLVAELSSIRNKLKSETQMNEKMRLNIEAKKIKNSISDLKQSL